MLCTILKSSSSNGALIPRSKKSLGVEEGMAKWEFDNDRKDALEVLIQL